MKKGGTIPHTTPHTAGSARTLSQAQNDDCYVLCHCSSVLQRYPKDCPRPSAEKRFQKSALWPATKIRHHRAFTVYQANVGVGWLDARVCQANVGVGGAPRGHVLASPIGAQTLDARVPLRFLDIRSQKKMADTRHSVDRLRLDLALLDVLLMACVTGRTFVAMDTGHHFKEHVV